MFSFLFIFPCFSFSSSHFLIFSSVLSLSLSLFFFCLFSFFFFLLEAQQSVPSTKGADQKKKETPTAKKQQKNNVCVDTVTAVCDRNRFLW